MNRYDRLMIAVQDQRSWIRWAAAQELEMLLTEQNNKNLDNAEKCDTIKGAETTK